MKLYTDLTVWIEGRKLVNEVYAVTKTFPKDELFGLTAQIRRCAVSIPSNIAEGCGRKSDNETRQFLYISRGSLYELETQLFIALDQKYLEQEKFTQLHMQLIYCRKLLNGFIKYYANNQDE